MVAVKELVAKNMNSVLIGVEIATYKSVGVELSLERTELIGSKVTREQEICELLGLFDYKGVAVTAPTYHLRIGPNSIDFQ